VPSPFEWGGKKSIYNLCYVTVFIFSRQAHNIGIVMLAGTLGTKNIGAYGSSYPFNLIGGDAHPDAGTAYQHTTVKSTSGHSSGYLPGNIRVIY